jgi:tRNA-splicing ligase RtcB (3'-phosphate/5'-hydroxy nucleic acid ligase)
MTTIIEEGNKIGKVFLEREAIESETYKQIVSMIKNETIEHARVMPDCHKSKNCCVGFTSHLINKIVPSFVGIDIGCGIVTYPLETEKKLKDWREKRLKNLADRITDEIIISKVVSETRDTSSNIRRMFDLANEEVKQFSEFYQEKFSLDLADRIPTYNEEWLSVLLKKIKSNLPEFEKALGTLGGGNHFIEFDRSENSGLEYVTVHSGSRIIGKKICDFHQNKIIKQNEVDWTYFDSEVEKFNKANKNKKERKAFRDQLREQVKIKDKKKYLDEEDAIDYYFDMIFGQKFALVNREVMIQNILGKLYLQFEPTKKIESIHNYIDFTDFVMRKGAINAQVGKECLIALNMTDGILLCEGKGNEDWNYSSAHGSGREMTRQKAIKNKQNIAKRLEKQLEKQDIISTAPLLKIVDEAPECYKESGFIAARISDSVTIKEQLKPFINIKDYSE